MDKVNYFLKNTKETQLEMATRWADSELKRLNGVLDSVSIDRLVLETWEFPEFQETACIAQQIYAEKMGWT